MTYRLAIVATHPIQYYAPVFRELANRSELDLKVFYQWTGLTVEAVDRGFGKAIAWDIPLLEGYEYEFLHNASADPGTHHFKGIDAPALCKALTDWKPDVIAVYGWNYKSHWKVLRHFHGKVPILFRGDSHLLDERNGFRTLMRRLWLSWVYSHVDMALAVGTENAKYFQKHRVRADHIQFAPHAVDNSRFSDSGLEIAGTRLRQQLRIRDCETVIAFVGKLEPKKSPDMLLKAFLACGRSDIHLVFVGSGQLQEQLQCLAPSRVHFVGFCNQTQIAQYYYMCDVLALPSRGPSETWGLVVNEAMACGRPVIVSDAVGCAADLVNANTGWVFPASNLQRLSELLRTLPDRSELGSMGKVCKRFIANWSVDRQVEGWVAAVERLCA